MAGDVGSGLVGLQHKGPSQENGYYLWELARPGTAVPSVSSRSLVSTRQHLEKKKEMVITSKKEESYGKLME